jgi:hypothetical protein
VAACDIACAISIGRLQVRILVTKARCHLNSSPMCGYMLPLAWVGQFPGA